MDNTKIINEVLERLNNVFDPLDLYTHKHLMKIVHGTDAYPRDIFYCHVFFMSENIYNITLADLENPEKLYNTIYDKIIQFITSFIACISTMNISSNEKFQILNLLRNFDDRFKKWYPGELPKWS